VPGVPAGERLDPAAVLARRDSFTAGWDDAGQVEWAEGAGITVIRGYGRISGVREVSVDGRTLTARHAVVVCTGSTPVRPPVPGLAEVRTWSSREATSAKAVPERLAVLGGGVVGVEMAQAWARLGSRVSLVVSADRPLHRMEPFVGDLVTEGLVADGVDCRFGRTAQRVAEAGDAVELTLSGGERVVADELLVATGRRPATDDIGIDTLGLEPGAPLAVDDSGLVSTVDGQWLYAAGDVTGRAPLTHQGKYAARVVGDVIAARAKGGPVDTSAWSPFSATADHVCVPQVVFTDPEVAFVGRTAEQATRDGIETEVTDVDIAVAGSALHADGYRGRARMVVDKRRRVVVGVTFVGQDVAELLHSATIAVAGEVIVDRIWHAVPAYPTISEVWLRLLEAYGL
ncbi:MAG: NAD(P)/FAD-dependent oxidoreductase, partial [Kutzneria sp.]|nr:NAD(P)/FAD-dependent oxidoreductase [Kutzneria sp.]